MSPLTQGLNYRSACDYYINRLGLNLTIRHGAIVDNVFAIAASLLGLQLRFDFHSTRQRKWAS